MSCIDMNLTFSFVVHCRCCRGKFCVTQKSWSKRVFACVCGRCYWMNLHICCCFNSISQQHHLQQPRGVSSLLFEFSIFVYCHLPSLLALWLLCFHRFSRHSCSSCRTRTESLFWKLTFTQSHIASMVFAYFVSFFFLVVVKRCLNE